MPRPLIRIDPKLPVQNMKTYNISQPLATHFRQATCAEFDCPNYINGWVTSIDESTDLGQSQAYYIRKQSGRHFAETRNEGGLTSFTFTPGQSCFAEQSHRISLERPAIFQVRGGDFRGNPTKFHRLHKTPEDWRDDLGEHQLKIREVQDRG